MMHPPKNVVSTFLHHVYLREHKHDQNISIFLRVSVYVAEKYFKIYNL